MFGIDLPSGSRVNNIRAKVHVNGAGVLGNTVALMYAVSGYVLPQLNPGVNEAFQTTWDTTVPMDDDTDTIDLDSTDAEAGSSFEPGEMAMENVYNIGIQPEKIYERQKMLSFANASMRQESASVLEWALADFFRINIKRNYFLEEPASVVFGFSNPDFLDTSSTSNNASGMATLLEDEYARIKYIDIILEQALMQFFGITEAGATVTWADAAELLRTFMEPTVYEKTAGAWASVAMTVHADVFFDVSVQGEFDKVTLAAG